MNKTKEKGMHLNAWSGVHGNEYTDRCDVDPKTRVTPFKRLLKYISNPPICYVLEVGCNKGHNLEAIDAINHEHDIDTIYVPTGIEPNEYAIKKSYVNAFENRTRVVHGDVYNMPWIYGTFDVVFTAGVLIHIPTDKLNQAMENMFNVSRKFIMFIEYESEQEKGTNYEQDFDYQEGVWSRPYGRIFEELMGDKVKKVAHGKMEEISNDGWAFSTKCSYWIYKKI